jgi:hypothetical protein
MAASGEMEQVLINVNFEEAERSFLQLGEVVYFCYHNYLGGRARRIKGTKQTWTKLGRLHLRTKIKTKG